MAPTNPIVIRRLYRTLLKVAKPFNPRYNDNAAVLNCLLHRTGLEDESWGSFLRQNVFQDDSQEEFSDEDEDESQAGLVLFRKLLREVVTGTNDGIRQMQFPSHIENGDRLRLVIRREFRDTPESISTSYESKTRREVAFFTLRELNKKLSWNDELETKVSKHPPHPDQSALGVSPLPLRPPSAYLRPGAFLIAHPHMSGYFRRSVICILDHKEDGDNDAGSKDADVKGEKIFGTYGLIVNRLCIAPDSGKNLTLEEILRPIPPMLLNAFGAAPVNEGGPVHMALQMIRQSSVTGEDDLGIGGHVLSTIPLKDDETTALENDRTTYYNGDILKAAKAVDEGKINREDITLFVGASCWSTGQLESEIERGFWLPCRGPIDIAISGICEHASSSENTGNLRPKADLWLSMLSACGNEEAKLAHLLLDEDGDNDCGHPCDDFD